ncbi:MAG: deoxyguanosinetriphosphate triphosphohydrolase [Chlorobia bacterium]|nr:deoxyguanosinetriphosphate triphosphohydrolase [Fimbriimonadaceae bacterium]
MDHKVREAIEAHERQWLSHFAAFATESKGRKRPEDHDPIRTCYMRDRDRILHSKAFRRLKHKTQVFIAPTGDHFRTRLTHTLEVSQIARTVSRALRLNEDLTEAIALGHDVGHPPFGHTGEQALDECLKGIGKQGTPTSFRHYDQSLRVLDILEDLNLTHEVLEGIGGHSKGQKDLSAYDGEPVSTLEAAAVRVSDRIAYLSHDIDDAVRAGVIQGLPEQFSWLGEHQSKRIKTMVYDVVEHSLDQPAIRMSERLMGTMNELKDWMFDHVYLAPERVRTEAADARLIVRKLFQHFTQSGKLPEGYQGIQGAVDYISGMTDRFAIEASK